MITRIIMPKLGMVMREGLVLLWYVAEGDEVETGKLLLDIESDKVTTEIEAPASGVLRKIIVREDEIVPCGTVIGIISDDADAQIPGLDALIAESRAAVLTREEWEQRHSLRETGGRSGRAETEVRLRISPAARRLAVERGVDLSRIEGTGPDGRIVRSDVLRAADGAPASATAAVQDGRPGEDIAVSRMRRSIADNMAHSARASARVVLFAEVDMTRAVAYRNENRAAFAEAVGADLSYNAILVKATASAMREDPVLNVSFQDGAIRRHADVNIGLAVALDEGLVTVSVKDADRKDLPAVAKESGLLIEKARSGGLRVDDVTGNSITISSLGGFDIESFTPIINLPEAAIIGVGTVTDRPVVRSGRIEGAPILKLSLSFDHRIVDGAPAARFLQLLKRKLETFDFI